MGVSWLASLLPLRRRSQTEVQALETGVRPSMCFDFVSSHPSRVALSLSRAVRLFPPLLLIPSSFFFMEPPQWGPLFLQESCTIQGSPCPWTSSLALPDRPPQTLVLFLPPPHSVCPFFYILSTPPAILVFTKCCLCVEDTSHLYCVCL